jgi:uncharacterized protein YjbI with pentapeptide repeats
VAEGFTCEVHEDYRSACEGLDFYGEQESKRYCVLHYPGEEKNKEDFLKVKKSKLDRQDYDFCGTVFPEGTSDFEGFEFDAGANFAGAIFLGAALFLRAQFSGTETNFAGAQFSGEWTSFSEAQFSGTETNFRFAQFSGELTDFSDATFNAEWTSFQGAQFDGTETTFSGARFSSTYTDFLDAALTKHVDFRVTTFMEKVEFWETKIGRQAWIWFGSHIVKPELLTFHTVRLHPGWFINADVRKVDFTDVKWYGMPGGLKGTLDEEINALKHRGVGAPYTLLAQACRRLSANSEENREYPLANEFHYWSMDALRKGRWRYLGWLKRFIKKNWRRIRARFGRIGTLLWIWRIFRREPLRHTIPSRFGLITTLYWALSGYGVRAGRALGVLVAVWAVFAILYMLLGQSELRVFSPKVWWLPSILAGFPAFVPSELGLFSVRSIAEGMSHIGNAMVYSLSTMARLNPKPKPAPGLFQFLVTAEGILGPLQFALLALAIRRKVMR